MKRILHPMLDGHGEDPRNDPAVARLTAQSSAASARSMLLPKKPRLSSDENKLCAAARFSYHQSAARSICRAALGEMRRAYVNDRVTLDGEGCPRR